MKIFPTKFESILRDDSLKFAPLIVGVDSDLRRFRSAARFNRAQGAGSLSIICNPPGQGKTTAVYAASVLLRDIFLPVKSMPAAHVVKLRDTPEWLNKNLPNKSDKISIILIDGREKTDDDQGLRDMMGAMNNLVRGRPDLLFVWPTTDEAWRDHLVETARAFGSQSFCPDSAVFSVDGPAKNRWLEVASLMLEQLQSTWDEFGINEASAEEIAKNEETLGDFLTKLNRVRIEQDDHAEEVTGLPEVVFVVSSHSIVVSHVARFRNPTTYRIRTDEIVRSARSQEVGKFWTERGAAQKGNLAWVSSLLSAKLLSLTPSTIAHACGLYSEPDSRLRAAVENTGFKAGRGAGSNAYRKTDLGRFLAGIPVPEVLNKNKGRTTSTTLAAFDAVQALSGRHHLAINRAILSLAAEASGLFKIEEVEFEKPLGGDAIVDAIVPMVGRRAHIEFHHLSEKHCNPNSIATYIMKKLRTYATQYNLIDR